MHIGEFTGKSLRFKAPKQNTKKKKSIDLWKQNISWPN